MDLLVHAPPGNIKLVRSLVAGVAVAGSPVPVPVIMPLFLIVGPVGCRTQPQVVIKCGWRFPVLGNTERIPWLEAQAPGHINVTNAAIVQESHGLHDALAGTALESDLDYGVVFTGRLHHFTAFKDIV